MNVYKITITVGGKLFCQFPIWANNAAQAHFSANKFIIETFPDLDSHSMSVEEGGYEI